VKFLSYCCRDEPCLEEFFETIAQVNKNILSLHNKFFKEIWPEIEERRDRLSKKYPL
jgi:hypothetical protein